MPDLTGGKLLCAQEPIHIPGTIQPHGALLVLDPNRDMTVIAASANIARFLPAGLASKGIIPGGKLGDLLGQKFRAHIEALLEIEGFRRGTPWEVSIQAKGECPELEASIYLQAGLVLVELEVLTFQNVAETLEATRILQRSIAQMQRTTTGSLADLAAVVVQAVRLLTGYERVLIYHFDQEGHGQALAENKVSDWDQSLSGQRFHASNIPPQARELYLLAPLRCMWNRDATPVPLQIDPSWAGAGVTGRAIDLSYAKLRSVSPTHLAIHRALGIDGLMSLSLIQDGKLWGLIVCHHRKPHSITPGQRAAAMVLANAFAVRVGPAERAQIEQARRGDAQRLSELFANMAAAEDVGSALTSGKTTIASLFNATGAAVLHNGKIMLVGNTPPKAAVLELASWLHNDDSDVFQTDRLPSLYPNWAPHAFTACGVVAVFLAADRSEMLLWFRGADTPLVDSDSTLEPEQALQFRRQASFTRVEKPRHAFARPWATWELEIAAALGHAVTEVIVRSLRRISNLNEQLSQFSRVHAAGAMASALAHELNQPLTATIGAVRAARRMLAAANIVDLPETLGRAMDLAADQALRAGLIIQRLRDFVARGGEADKRPESVQTIVEEAQTLALIGLAEAGISITVGIDANLPLVMVDRVQIQQVLVNLIRNAMQAMTDQDMKGLDGAALRRDLVVTATVREAELVELAVADTGPGLSPNVLERLFEPFITTKPDGMGVGLSICRPIIEAHGGRLWTEPNPGGGTVFRFTVEAVPLE